MTNYICLCVFFFKEYHLMQKGTFSVIVQCHFQISVLQHWSNTFGLINVPEMEGSHSQVLEKSFATVCITCCHAFLFFMLIVVGFGV